MEPGKKGQEREVALEDLPPEVLDQIMAEAQAIAEWISPTLLALAKY